jgi:hypothetical protein
MLKSGNELAPSGFEDAALGIRESGEVRGGELAQRALDVVEARGDLGGGAAQRGSPWLGGSRLGGSRIPQERLPRGLVGTAIGGQERLRLARGEQVALDGAGEPELLPGGERREGAGQRERQAAAVNSRGQVLRQTPAERQAALHPLRLSTQELGDRGRRVTVLAGERRHDPSLVHGAGGLGGRIGLEQPRLGGGAPDRLDDDGHVGAIFPSPAGQAFETIEDLKGAVLALGHAQRHRRQVARLSAGAPQRRERRPEALDGDQEHLAHLGSSIGSN